MAGRFTSKRLAAKEINIVVGCSLIVVRPLDIQKTYIELDVWKVSRELVSKVYTLTKSFPKDEMYGLTSQIRRCAISVPSNIAEGCGRNHSKDSMQFFHIARGSLYELETQLYLSYDQQYIDEPELNASLEQVIRCKKLLNGFINYYQKL